MTGRTDSPAKDASGAEHRDRPSANTKKMEGHSTENNLPELRGVHPLTKPTAYADLGDAISLNLYLQPSKTL
jgi:hypothetical protein